MATIIGGAVASKALGWCRTQRVAVTGLWNSNGLQGGFGLIEAIQQSFVSAGIKLFAAGPITLTSTNQATNADNLNGSFRSNNSCIGWQRVPTSAPPGPPATNILLDPANVLALDTFEARRYNYGRGNDGSGIEYPNLYRMLHFKNNNAVGFNGCACGIIFTATAASPFHINPAAALRSDHWYTDKTAAGGTFTPSAIQGSVPNSPVANGGTITVGAGAPTAMSRATFDVPAGARDIQLVVGHCAGVVGGRPTGEVGFGFQVTWERDALAGVLVAPFESMGGWSTRDFANNLARVDGSQCYAEAIDHWIDVVVRPILDASQTPRMIFFINEGSNEAAETGTSIPNGYAGGSLDAWKDNVSTIIATWRARWAAKGYAADDFVVALCPDHPNLTAGETARASFASTGVANLVAASPSNTFGINSLGRWSTTALKNLGVGREAIYERSSGSQTITAIGIAFEGAPIDCTVANTFASTDTVWITGTNSTPSINGTWDLSARTGTTITLANPDVAFSVTGAGTTGAVRTIDSYHLASIGVNGATASGYRTYWAGIFEQWSGLVGAKKARVSIDVGV